MMIGWSLAYNENFPDHSDDIYIYIYIYIYILM